MQFWNNLENELFFEILVHLGVVVDELWVSLNDTDLSNTGRKSHLSMQSDKFTLCTRTTGISETSGIDPRVPSEKKGIGLCLREVLDRRPYLQSRI